MEEGATVFQRLIHLFFRFDGRIGQASFFFGALGVIAAVIALFVGGNILLSWGTPYTNIAFTIVILVLGKWSLAALAAKRAHDLGEHHFQFRVVSDEILELRMLFEEGEARPNRFGATPGGLSRKGPLRFRE